MPRSAIALLLLGLLSTGAPSLAALAAEAPAGEPAATGRASAARQLARAERALAATRRAAQAPRAELPRSAAGARPFWTALDRMSRALEQADAGLRASDARYFAALGEGSRALAELEAVWARARRQDPAVGSVVAALSTSYRRLRNGYGWEAMRRRQGGGLTPAEARRFQALKQGQAKVAERLKPVQAKAAKAGDPAMAEQLKRLRAQAQRIASAELTLEAYLTAELLNDLVQGAWAASQHYVKPAYRTAWRKAAPTVEKLATDPNVGFVFTADLSKAEAWSFDEAETESPTAPAAEGRPGARQAPGDTPVDDVEIVDGETHRSEGVAPDPADRAPEAPALEAPAAEGAPAESPAPVESAPPAEAAPRAESAPPADVAPPAESAPAQEMPPAESAPPAEATAGESEPPAADSPDEPAEPAPPAHTVDQLGADAPSQVEPDPPPPPAMVWRQL